MDRVDPLRTVCSQIVISEVATVRLARAVDRTRQISLVERLRIAFADGLQGIGVIGQSNDVAGRRQRSPRRENAEPLIEPSIIIAVRVTPRGARPEFGEIGIAGVAVARIGDCRSKVL